ncbi:MAG TPA: GvpL/GvpF family gas vesicle protein [Thermoanaerobaculia bacterium]
MPRRYLLLGAHLDRADVEGIESVEALDGGVVTLSAISYDSDQGIAARSTIERAAAARQALARRETFVAIRYGATAANEAEAREKCSAHAARWRTLLTAYRGHLEITLRLGAASGALRPDGKDFQSGRAYLQALQQTRAVKTDPDFLAAVDAAMSPIAVKRRWRTREDGMSEFVALIRRDDLVQARAAGESLRESFPQIPFLLSGPWPLEVFAHDE